MAARASRAFCTGTSSCRSLTPFDSSSLSPSFQFSLSWIIRLTLYSPVIMLHVSTESTLFALSVSQKIVVITFSVCALGVSFFQVEDPLCVHDTRHVLILGPSGETTSHPLPMNVDRSLICQHCIGPGAPNSLPTSGADFRRQGFGTPTLRRPLTYARGREECSRSFHTKS